MGKKKYTFGGNLNNNKQQNAFYTLDTEDKSQCYLTACHLPRTTSKAQNGTIVSQKTFDSKTNNPVESGFSAKASSNSHLPRTTSKAQNGTIVSQKTFDSKTNNPVESGFSAEASSNSKTNNPVESGFSTEASSNSKCTSTTKQRKETKESVERLKQELEKCQRDLETCQQEKDVYLSRLSELMGQKLEENNPQLTNLNDPNRPQKLAETLGDIYDNEWTETFSELQTSGQSERGSVDLLLNLLKIVYTECLEHINRFLCHIQQWFTRGTDCPHSKIMEFILSVEDIMVSFLREEIFKVIASKYSQQLSICRAYILRCIRLCFYMTIKTPVMLLDFDSTVSKIDRTCYRYFTKCGDSVDYMVWPALFLHKDGPLITKGVVECV